jgi:EmrB/QacA subfamily drug resistance transporter
MASFVQPPCDGGVIRSTAAVTPCTGSTGRWILTATILGSSMAFIDGTVVNVALPALEKGLDATVLDMQWVVEAYSLPLAALLLVGGSLGDHYGRRRMFLIGVAIFCLASAWAGFAPDIHQLISARGVQGLGGALLVPGSLAIIGASFRGEARGRAIGIWSGFTAITAAIGPVLGGWLIQQISWRAVFFLNLPLGIIVFLISLQCVPESRDENQVKRLDWLGAALATLGLGLVVYGLIEHSRSGLSNSGVRAALIGGSIFLVTFVVVEVRSQNPMLPLGLFWSGNFAGANLMTFFLYSALGGTLFFLPLNLIQVQGYTPTAAGAALLPFILIVFLLSRWSGGLMERYGAKTPLVIGPIIAAVGFALFAVPGLQANYWTKFFPPAVVLGLGMAVSVAPLTTTVMNAVPGNRVGIASGINNAISRAAGLLAVAIFGILILYVFNRSLDFGLARLPLPQQVIQSLEAERIKLAGASVPGETPEPLRESVRLTIKQSFVQGFRSVMLVGATLALTSGIISLLLISDSAGGRKP